MENETAGNQLSNSVSAPGCSTTGCLLWFLGGISLSFTVILSLVLIILLMGSVTLNVYLGWQLSELEVTISRISPTPPQIIVVTATQELAVAPTANPVSINEGAGSAADPSSQPVNPAAIVVVTATPTATPISAQEQVDAQMGTVTAITTAQIEGDENPEAFVLPTATYGAIPINPTVGNTGETTSTLPNTGTSETEPSSQASAPAAQPTPTPPPPPTVQAKVAVSSNSYDLIPIEGERESRPAERHGDLNLALREPKSIEVDLNLVDIDNAGSDPHAPNLGKVFDPEFISAYTIHGWDWESNSKGSLIEESNVVLLGLKTKPGEPVYIPHKKQDIYHGKYYATVLYASEDSLTFVYARKGNVVEGYTVHYVGLQTDPNLLKLFKESTSNQLPGLTLDTPVGAATDELIVAIRDNGTFLDARSLKDWWD